MMEQVVHQSISDYVFKPRKVKLWIGAFVLIIGLFVLQDYLYSQIRETGFYISESLLYNSIWLFTVPLTFLVFRLLSYFQLNGRVQLTLFLLLISGLFVLLHITLFTSFFVSVSYLVYSPSHRFIRIFTSALSNEFGILAIYYFSVPFLSKLFVKPAQEVSDSDSYHKSIKLKKGLKTISIDIQAIAMMTTDKPYTMFITDKESFFDHRTLKELQTILDPTQFIRVNRSTLINKYYIREVISRKNGDYDAVLRNDKTVRLSRHYRSNWQNLLH
ncbi:MAG: LytTR family DNA-binding domain-containing protein [Bacteroidota bacterium]